MALTIILDLCVSAALDAVKERVEVPWKASKKILEADASIAAITADSETVVEPSVQPASSTSTRLEDSLSMSTPEDVVAPAESSEESSADPSVTPATESSSEPSAEPAEAPEAHRVLHWRNFSAALKEITPSASEALGSLADLRKWNEEFGEGRAERKKQVWGKGRFGFTVQTLTGDEGKVQPSTPSSSSPSSGAV